MSKEHSEKKKQINIAAAAIAAVLVICLCTVFAMGKKAPGKTETEAVSGAGTVEAETTQEPVDWNSLDKVTLNQHKYGLLHKVTTWLILGTDASGDEKGTGEAYQGAMADFLMLVVFDEENKTYGAIQLNRDTMTEVSLIDKQGEGEATAEIQLCTAHWYGGSRQQNCENTVKAVSKLLGGIPIDGYYEMPMDTIPLLNKQAGGVKVKLLEDFTFVDPQMKKGRKMILNDTQAYHYIHDRYGVGDEENTSRMKRQRQYLGSLVKKIKKQAASDKKILARIMNELNPYVVSKISTKKLTHYAGSLSEYQYKGLLTIKGTVKTGKALGDGIEHREFYPDASSLEQTVKTLYPLVAKDELQTAG